MQLIEKILGKFGKNARFSKVENDLYLTNSKILIRIKDAAKDFRPGLLREIKAETTIKVWNKSAITSPESQLIEKICALSKAPEKCEKCNGIGFYKLCEKCDGAGEYYCDHCDNYSDCKACSGSGLGNGEEMSCEDCKGSGFKATPVKCLNATFDLNYLRIVADIAPGSLIFKPNEYCPGFFKNETIDGLIMIMGGVE